MKKSYLLVLCITCFLFLVTCDKYFWEDDEENNDTENDPPLTEEELAVMDTLATIDLKPGEVEMPNGLTLETYLKDMDSVFWNQWNKSSTEIPLGPRDVKNLLVAKMTMVAISLSDRSVFTFPDEGNNAPAHYGLAYSYGSKQYTQRREPPAGECNERIYGLDCSGFVYQMFTVSGVAFPIGPANKQRETGTILNALNNAYPEMKKFKVENLGKLPSSKFQTGDIIYWWNGIRAYHIGMILKGTANRLVIAHCTGSQYAPCERNYLWTKRGVVLSDLNTLINATYNKRFRENYRIVRIQTEISGDWVFHLRCAGQTTDLFQLDLEFPTSENTAWDLTKTAVDYDGSTNTFYLEFSYDKEQNILSCAYTMTDSSMPDFERKDQFFVKLEFDDTGYITAQNVYLNNGSGCTEEVRLVNKETLDGTDIFKMIHQDIP